MAAYQNNPQALYYIGLMYANGQGVPIDGIMAKYYFEKALSLGEKNAYIYI